MAYTNATRIANQTVRYREARIKAKPAPMIPKGLLNKPDAGKINDNMDIASMLKQRIKKEFDNA
tara:strand:- start:92 stop:283 length:192 start_codon:yes stop_codon:yes gene_type:complete